MANAKTILVSSGSLEVEKEKLNSQSINGQLLNKPSCWQVQCDAVLWVVSVLDIAKEADKPIESSYNYHSNIQNTACSAKRFWSFHVVFERNDNANRLECEQNCSEIKGKAFDWSESGPLRHRRQVLEHVVENEAQTDKRQNVCWKRKLIKIQNRLIKELSSYRELKTGPAPWDSLGNWWPITARTWSTSPWLNSCEYRTSR